MTTPVTVAEHAGDGTGHCQAILDTLAVPRTQRDEYMTYFFDGFWPYVEVMVDEEVEILESLIAPPTP